MKYMPSACPKCGSVLVRSPKGGRPSRWCSEGCKRAGEEEMARLSSLLKQLEGQRADIRMRGGMPERITEVMGDLQGRYDHLAGVPN